MQFDVAVIGAGAAGMMCAAVAGQRGLRVALIDHSAKIGEKIRISGGGRCNFTNVDAAREERFISEDPRFARHALQAYRPEAFIALVRKYGIDYHEKHRGQLFCDRSAEQIVQLLKDECALGGVQWFTGQGVQHIEKQAEQFELRWPQTTLQARAIVIATGGPSIPKIGATDWGQQLAATWGHRLVPLRPALVPLTFAPEDWPFSDLAGLSVEVDIRAGDPSRAQCVFREDLLFTHRGLSGPAVLQASSYWHEGEALNIDLSAGMPLQAKLLEIREKTRSQVDTVLAQWFPKRMVETWLKHSAVASIAQRKLAEQGNKQIQAIAQAWSQWTIRPNGSEGYRKAEVTAGGVATDEINPRTMQSLRVPGMYFIGEVVDVTGWLGGYNFQWAWASGVVAGQAIAATPQ
jgi:predicted Rossmann fold flavoprotein